MHVHFLCPASARQSYFWERIYVANSLDDPFAPKFFDYLTTPRWMLVLLVWALVFIGLGIASMFI